MFTIMDCALYRSPQCCLLFNGWIINDLYEASLGRTQRLIIYSLCNLSSFRFWVWTCWCVFVYLSFIFASAHPGPFNSTLGTDLALKQITEHRRQLDTLKQEENTIMDGLGFFKIEQPPSKMIQMLEKVWNNIRNIVLLSYWHLVSYKL